MRHFGMKLFSPGELDTSLCLNCAISSYQIQMCIRPELNPQQRHMTVIISLDILTFFYLFCLFDYFSNDGWSNKGQIIKVLFSSNHILSPLKVACFPAQTLSSDILKCDPLSS